MRILFRLGSLGLLLCLVSSGCSVVMALSGEPEPNFEAIEVGSPRSQVETELGKPVSSQNLENGHRKDTYQYEMGDPPNGHRALMNLYIDLATIMLWEFPGTIVEAMMGEDRTTYITYNPEGSVKEITGYTPPPLSQAHQEAIQAQERANESQGLPD